MHCSLNSARKKSLISRNFLKKHTQCFTIIIKQSPIIVLWWSRISMILKEDLVRLKVNPAIQHSYCMTNLKLALMTSNLSFTLFFATLSSSHSYTNKWIPTFNGQLISKPFHWQNYFSINSKNNYLRITYSLLKDQNGETVRTLNAELTLLRRKIFWLIWSSIIFMCLLCFTSNNPYNMWRWRILQERCRSQILMSCWVHKTYLD